MKGLRFIKSKQQSWAKRKGFNAIGGTIPGEGEKNYLSSIADNLFEPLSKENLESFASADGQELKDSDIRLAKMKALHSSSALVVNLFQYWQGKDVIPILNACKLCSRSNKVGYMIENVGSDSPKEIAIVPSPLNYEIKFEEQFEISENKVDFPRSPNVDVVIHAPLSGIAIESKFTEPYNGNKHDGLSLKYVESPSFWEGLPNLYELAKEISPDDNRFRYLHAAQLIKHILGLKKSVGNQGNSRLKHSFRLLYLWYDVLGEDGVEHRKEIEQFAEIARKDQIKFSHITYQEVIARLSKDFYDGNEAYCNYLTDRYL